MPARILTLLLFALPAFAAIFYAATTLALLVLLRPEMISEIKGIADGAKRWPGCLPRRGFQHLLVFLCSRKPSAHSAA